MPSPLQPHPGFVSLLGGGPGSADLLTLRGLKALQQAEVILYDALLEEDFQALFPPEAIALPVGKRGGEPSTSQAHIQHVMLEQALAGRRVVRLKGGDPLLFGRGGEEALALEAAGLPFEIIPGVSALQGAAAAAGIPLTHRGTSREVRILEGHHLLEEGTDWAELAQTQATLAIFMGTRPLPAIARKLLEHGAPEDLPVALAEGAQCRGQTLTLSTLALAAQGHLQRQTSAPGLIFIGTVIHHRFHPTSFQRELPHDLAAFVPGSVPQAGTAGGRGQRRAS